MPWNGSGTYVLPPAYSPEVNGTVIDAARYNGLTSDVATGISAALAKNGENTPTANLPMGGFKHTGAAAANAAGQYLTYGQALNGTSLVLNGSITGATDISSSGNTSLGDSATDTLSVAGSAIRFSTGAWQIPVPSSGIALTVNQVTGSASNGLNVVGDGGSTSGSLHIKTIGTGSNFSRLGFGVNNSGAYIIAGGSVANPDIIFANNDGNVEVLRLASDGSRVQTGNGGGAASKFRALQWSNYYADFGITNTGIVYIDSINNGTNGPISFRRNGTETLGISANGNFTIAAPSSGTALSIVGGGIAVTGNSTITGTLAGITTLTATTLAGTLSTAAQGNVTSLGTLTALTISGALTLTAATSKIVPGATSFAIRNTGDSVDNFLVNNDGRLFAASIHNNGSGASGTTPMIASGTFTATATAVTNVSAATGLSGTWLRVGNTVTVAVGVSVTPTAAAGAVTVVDLTLPIASNLTTSPNDLQGTANCSTITLGNGPGILSPEIAGDKARLSFTASNTGAGQWACVYQYEVK